MAIFKSGSYFIRIEREESLGKLSNILIITMLATFIQIIIGTQVREEVDVISAALEGERGLWIDALGEVYLTHRLFSYVLAGLHLWLGYLLMKRFAFHRGIRMIVIALFATLVFSIISGNILNYMDLPAAIQPVHLLLATMLSGMQFLLYLLVVTSKKEI